jgi:uncharacterized protein (TIGR02300 family)
MFCRRLARRAFDTEDQSVAKPEWGTKRICPSCGARYYDLRKDPPVCPSCGVQFDPEALLKSRRARPTTVDDVKKAPQPLRDVGIAVGVDDEVADIEDADAIPVEDIEEEAEDEEDVLIEDASELGEDDMGEVVDVDVVSEDEEGR